ncbi:hypothetical protein A3C23_04690 [Candidatus Roizmanbacteria bacterium RIFCSPHIGHO2_02_FULL_37_13b]|uniref:Uncharacterized protein n=1 Tax=Candidatus Roizmanbacteria bacterium RIFCSPLOWO2_02_FULL_36_11 TaxID=1802071 RepID=A0A1F7JHC2_9BACT|nr:MAG: hypothetical protein A3C23_04690 [Candidatus Roizmanbacteria bacterium RIFCSPHIGHO2_02_FULL_37_13b]OGK55005.1 MAG: hypothetical protein A3H78_00835 [Candidatus Roizmanbacteria bacterium RIFCSPLOWO2_02_FULL_36_11]
MDIIVYIAISALIITIWHFAFNTSPKDFGLMQMIGVFALGGGIGYAMNSIEVAVLFSIILSLIFI